MAKKKDDKGESNILHALSNQSVKDTIKGDADSLSKKQLLEMLDAMRELVNEDKVDGMLITVMYAPDSGQVGMTVGGGSALYERPLTFLGLVEMSKDSIKDMCSSEH